MQNHLTSVESRDNFFKRNCDKCASSLSCFMRDDIGYSNELAVDDMNSFFSGEILSEFSDCNAKKQDYSFVSSDDSHNASLFSNTTPSLF